MESLAIGLGFLPQRLRFSSPFSLSRPLPGSSTFPTPRKADSIKTKLVWNKPQRPIYLSRGVVVCSSSSSRSEPRQRGKSEQFRGKSGSVSFNGLTHQIVEESKLVSAPFQEEEASSFLWILAPVIFISSLILPQFFLSSAIEATFKNDTVAEIVTSLCYETIFYSGLAIFLAVTDRVQRPYLEFSTKRWGLITGLRGYLTSAFLMMGLKVVVPVFAVYMTWPALGVDALVAVLPFLLGCAVQRGFEAQLDRRGSSCWPIVPIVFEVYRLYQVTRAATFIQRLMFMMKDAATTVEITERGVALVGLVVTLQLVAVLCLWSLITFLMRLFPSRPVAENY